jgi:hypothetical protein
MLVLGQGTRFPTSRPESVTAARYVLHCHGLFCITLQLILVFAAGFWQHPSLIWVFFGTNVARFNVKNVLRDTSQQNFGS